MKLNPTLLCFIPIALMGCQGKEKIVIQPSTPTVEKAPVPQVGELDAKGHRVIYLVKQGSFPTPISLYTKYGFMLVNDGNEKNPKPRYILGFQNDKRVLDTHNLSEFKRALAKIPKRSSIARYETCQVWRSWGLKQSQCDAFDLVIKRSKLKVPELPEITCYCDAMG